MKTFYINLLIGVLMSFTLFSCSPNEESYEGLDTIPLAETIDCTVSVNQETNLVTFTMNNKSCFPVWIINGKDVSTINGFSKLFPKAGDYTVEVKIGNRSGISDGSVSKNFHVDKTLVDKALIKSLCNAVEGGTKDWIWNSTVNGHLGCGPAFGSADFVLATYGVSWWSCAANGQKDSGMYDDTFTFASDSIYTYDPGVGGTIFVNKEVTVSSLASYNTNDGADFKADANKQITKWELSYEGDDLYIIFPKGTFVGYVPNDAIYNNPKFKVLSISDSKLLMVADNGDIAWRYEFVPKL